jgi:putative ABC transport system permease protein
LFRNYVKIALRNALKNRVFSFINLAGLAIGIACFLLIFLFLRFEYGYDRFHEKHQRIYRVIKECGYPGGITLRADSGAPMSPLLQENFPEFENAVRFGTWYESLIGYGSKVFSEPQFYFADAAVFDVFTFPLRLGDARSALHDPFSVVLSSRAAEKYFGDEDPIGKVITCRFSFRREPLDLKVTGVLEKVPQNSHFIFDFLASFETLKNIVNQSYLTERWDSTTYNYVLLRENQTVEGLESRLQTFADTYIEKHGYTSMGLRLQPLKDIYFRSRGIGGGIWQRGNERATHGFLALALFVLLLACVNYMNLSTARSALRAKEVGLRKVVGAKRSSLILQFLSESLFFSFLSLLLALALVKLLLPLFRSLTQVDITFSLNDTVLGLILAALVLGVGLLSGYYPALVLSAFRPVRILKGMFTRGSSDLFRKALVVFQFSITAVLIIGSVVVFRQLNFLKSKDMGFDKEHVLVFPFQEISLHEKYPVIKNELLREPNVLGVTAISTIPGVGSQNGIKLKTEDVDELDMGIIYVDYDFVETLGIRVNTGRPFDRELASDAQDSFLVNQTFLQQLDWDSAVGQELELFYKRGEQVIPRYRGRIIGMLQDFNFRELHVGIQPVIFKIEPDMFQYMLIKINGLHRDDAIAAVREVFLSIAPNHPFEYSFLDSTIADAYRREQTFGTIINYAAGLAVLVACLGLFGLTSFAVQQRTKEIGIRKILGASVRKIVVLLTWDFLKLVLIANAIAWPVGYYIMFNWLKGFAYRTSVGIVTLLLAGVLTVAVAMLTASFQATRAAVSNPADSLRYE